MMHLLHTYLADSLEKKIKQSQVVVWYDPRSEFSAFIRELSETLARSLPSLRAVGSTSRKPVWKPYGLEAEPAVMNREPS